MNDPISVTRHGHVAQLVFACPAPNYVTVALLRGLADTLAVLDDDPDCRAVVLASDGKAFSAGADLAAAEGGGVGGATADPLREFYDQALRVFCGRKPIVAAIQGAAVGAGLGLAVAADFRVASPEARFCANFVKLGFHPGFALTHTLPRLIGAQRAALMFLTARRFKPEEVLPWGLIDEIAPPDAVRASALRLAGEIAENAPLALLAVRKTLRADLRAAATVALALEHAEQTLLQQTEDYAEGIRAVAERRAGRFVGR
jgi:enoyl-CoA hydratase/carnithine racemase